MKQFRKTYPKTWRHWESACFPIDWTFSTKVASLSNHPSTPPLNRDPPLNRELLESSLSRDCRFSSFVGVSNSSSEDREEIERIVLSELSLVVSIDSGEWWSEISEFIFSFLLSITLADTLSAGDLESDSEKYFFSFTYTNLIIDK